MITFIIISGIVIAIIIAMNLIKTKPKEKPKSVMNTLNEDPKFQEMKGLFEALSKLNYPLYHLDFETFTPTLPIYNNTSPSQVIPFQYSLHIEHEDNTIEHKEYLAQYPLIDPREELIVRLLNDIKGDSSIVVYSTYEATTLKNLADEFPQYSEELLSIRSRLWDLAEIFNKRYINFYQLKNKYSLKYVMPILVPKMSNKYLELKLSETPFEQFERMMKKFIKT